MHEPIDRWSLVELNGHYMNLRMQVSPSMDRRELLPENQFRLYAVGMRYPQGLSREGVVLEEVQEGVYDVSTTAGAVRLIVASQLRLVEHNALLHLLSGDEERALYGARHYPLVSSDASTLLQSLVSRYRLEAKEMNPRQLMDELKKKTIREVLESSTVEERLEGIPLERRLEGIPLERRLEGIPLERRLEGIPPDQLADLLTPEQLEALKKRFLKNGASGTGGE
jgi:hypothetical protein